MNTLINATRGRFWLLAGATGLVVGLAAWLQFAGPGIDRTKVYRIRYGNDAPLHYKGPDGLPAGLAVELVKEAARRNGIKLEWLHVTGADQIPVDFNVLQTIRPNRLYSKHYTAPYLRTESCFQVRGDSPFREEKDLRTARISFLDFAVHRESLALILPAMQPVPVASGREALVRLAEGLADAAYLNQYSAAASLQQGGSLPAMRMLPTSLPKRDLGLGSTLAAAAVADEIRSVMRTMGDDGTVAAILKRWDYFPNLTSDTIGELAYAQRRVRWLVGGITGLGIGLSLVLWLALRSRRQTRQMRRTEVALRESEGRFRTIFENEPECVKVLDQEGRVLEMNPAGLAMIQATSDQVRGGKAVELVAEEDRAAFNAMVAAVFRGETRHLVFDMIGLQGRRLTMETVSVPLKDTATGGGVTALLGVTRDITERKQAEHELQKRLEELVSWHRVTLGRENRVLELKQEVNELLAKLGQSPRYDDPNA